MKSFMGILLSDGKEKSVILTPSREGWHLVGPHLLNECKSELTNVMRQVNFCLILALNS